MADILNQGPSFWLPPDFLDDDGDDDGDDDDDDFLITAHQTLLHNYYSAFPLKLPYSSLDMESTHQKPKMVPVSPQTRLAGLGPSFKSPHVTPNAFRFPHPSPPPRNPLASLYADYYNNVPLPYDNYDLLKQDTSTISTCGRRTSRDDVFYCSHQKFMFQNRQGNRVFGYGGSETMFAWPPLSQQRPNTPPLRGGSFMKGVFLNGSHEVKRKCAGTGVFLPRQYGNPISDCRKKPVVWAGFVTPPPPPPPPPVRFERHFEEAMAARSSKVQLMNQKQRLNLMTEGGSSNELCLPHEWAY